MGKLSVCHRVSYVPGKNDDFVRLGNITQSPSPVRRINSLSGLATTRQEPAVRPSIRLDEGVGL